MRLHNDFQEPTRNPLNMLEQRYNNWLSKTGDPRAAATMVLAEVQSSERQTNERDTLNPRDVAKKLSVSPATVIEWIRSGQLKAANIATGPRPRFVIKPDDLTTFLDNRQPIPPVARRHRPRTTSKRF